MRRKSIWCPYLKKKNMLGHRTFLSCSKESCDGCNHNPETKEKS